MYIGGVGVNNAASIAYYEDSDFNAHTTTHSFTTMPKKQSSGRNNARQVPKSVQRAQRSVEDMFPNHATVSAYAAVLAHPFESEADVGCPTWPALASEKTAAHAYGTAYAGTTGFGYVCANTETFGSSATVVANVIHCTAAYTGSTVTTTTGATVVGTAHDGALTAADFSSDLVESRRVACGLRVRYTGRSDAMAGMITIADDPLLNGFNGMSVSDIRNLKTSDTIEVTREWTTVVWTPIEQSDYEYTNSTTSKTAATLALVFSGCEAGAQFEWEYVLHYEKIGRIARGVSQTPVEDGHAKGIASHVAQVGKAELSAMLNKHGGRALSLGKKLVSDYAAKKHPNLFRTALKFGKMLLL